MDKHTLKALDFPRICEILAAVCQTQMGREQALALEPELDRPGVEAELDRVEALLALSDEPPLIEVKDLRPLLARLRVQGVLSGPELRQILQSCTGLRRCRDFFLQRSVHAARLSAITSGLVALPEVEREIDRTVDDAGGVRDSATPELAAVRARLRLLRDRLVERLELMLADRPDWFSGAVTIRGDRFVLPLLLEHRTDLPGVVHGSSGSGRTLFVEPLDTVTEGNERAELRDAETEEVARILRRLSLLVAEHEVGLTRALTAVAALDTLVARRRFALRYECTRPVVSDRSIELIQARHPLLLRRNVEVVPLSLRFPDDTAIVLVSGPNAGGKTVVLKTVGLLSLMLKCGMYLPVGAGTRLPVFGSVFADIGDEQSLDSDLSSFTAHLGRLTEILAGASRSSLVLIDEIGASTAPEEGAALASAVLESLRDRDLKAVVTTHFGALKMFARDEPGIANAAMEWGRDQSQRRSGPTFRLTMGLPGESSAFEIAEAVGLPSALVDRARLRMGREWLDMSAKLRVLNEELESASKARLEADRMRQEVDSLRREYEGAVSEMNLVMAAEREKLRVERQRLLLDKRRDIENLVRQIKESQAKRESVVEAKALVEQELVRLPPEPVAEVSAEPAALQPKPGDTVESRTFRRRGSVVEVVGSAVTVAFGQIRMTVEEKDLKVVESDGAVEQGRPMPESEFRFDPKLNVRGMTREEADEAVGRFLDEAAASGSHELFILHGKGTGALRQMLWRRLRRDQRVVHVKLAESAEGGSGVTLVTLKEAG